ncbi:MAG: hypothetical protein KKD38_00765 [Candidatus Delongbacteria bacterium]|nr:hypothetical protein [Candidatus Delongbacteria bacterium]MCG2761283.1 hypothetical protein [Candidatus Delongbacteria bacterium]
MRFLSISILFLLLLSCGFYSFSGKSIPPDIKNAQLLLFEDNTGRYDLSLPEMINEKMLSYIEDYNYFIIENSSDADSKIYGSVKSYSEKADSQTRDEIIDQMSISISVEINFYDNQNNEFIVKNLIISNTEYFEASGGDTARDEAFVKLLDRLSENIVLGLSSNW